MDAAQKLKDLVGMEDPVTGLPLLRMILDLHRCQVNVPRSVELGVPGGSPRYPGWDQDVCDAFADSLGSKDKYPYNAMADPNHWVQAEVISVEGPDDWGRVTAWSASKDRTVGPAENVLKRLLECSREG